MNAHLSHLSLLAALPRPAAVIGRPQAAGDIAARLTTAFNDFQSRHKDEMRGVQNAVDDINQRIAAIGVRGSVIGEQPVDPDYTRIFATWSRSGLGDQELRAANREGERAQVQAAMSAGSQGDGGYLAPTEWDRQVNKRLASVSPIRRIANVVPTSVRAYSTVWNTAAWGSGWVGETANRPQTSSATLAPLVFDHGEIYAMPAITQQLLDDAQFDIDNWIITELETEFAKQEDIAFVAGNGVNKPRGFLTYIDGGSSDDHHPGGNLAVDLSGHATQITADALVTFVYSLPAPYRQNAVWVMSSATAAIVALLKDGQGNYLWKPAFAAGQPATLLGYRVEIDENMPAVAAGALPIAFGDFQKGYTINDRLGTRILRDPFTMKPYVLFYATKRVGGGVADPHAIRLLKIAAS